MSEKPIIQILVGVFVLLIWMDLKGSILVDPDEPRYAEIPREMLATGDFVTPRLNDSNYFEKPPLLYWANALSMKIFGETPFAARFPTRLAAMGIVLLLIFFLPLGGDPIWGWRAALIYLSAPLSFSLSRVNLTDGPLSFGMTLIFLSLRGFIQAVENNQGTKGWALAIGLGSSMAVLSKGPVGIVLPGMVFIFWTLITNKRNLWPKLLFSPAPVIFFLLTIPWFVLVEQANPGFAKFFFIHEHLLRYATKIAQRQEPFYFFILTFLWGFLPWLIPFFKSLKAQKPDRLFFILWFFCIVGFFSLSQSKLIPYILPAFPAAAALAAKEIKKSLKYLFWAATFAVFYLSLIFILPSKLRHYSEFDLAEKALGLNADQIIGYKCYPQSFPWILKEPIPTVAFQGELASDGVMSPELFWSAETFWTYWNSDVKLTVCLPTEVIIDFEVPSIKPMFIIDKSRRSFLVTNFKPS